jgi:hypothetical protein
LVDVERQILQDFIGTASWDHRPLITVLVGQVAERLGEPDGIIAFDPSSFPKRGIHSVGVKVTVRPPGQGRQLSSRRLHGVRVPPRSALLDFSLSHRGVGGDQQRRRECTCHRSAVITTGQCLEMLDEGSRCPTAG